MEDSEAASIAKEKMSELCRLIPGLKNEIDWRPGKTKASKDMVTYQFKNSSTLDIMAARASSRGLRKTGGLIEEAILVDGNLLNEIIIPTMNVDRRLSDGSFEREEVTNKSQIYVTTAGWKRSFAYEKLITLLIQQIIEPEKAMVMGGTWRVPVYEELLSKNFIRDLKIDGTYNNASFSREYESEWSGDAENAYFSSEQFDKHRTRILFKWKNKKESRILYSRDRCWTKRLYIRNCRYQSNSAVTRCVYQIFGEFIFFR